RRRPPARAHPPRRDRLRARPGGGGVPAAHAELAVSRRRVAARARRAHPAGQARPGLARPLPLLHRVHPAVAPALPRPGGWDRRLDQALTAFDRVTTLGNPGVIEPLRSRTTFGATELEAFATCSSIWFVERLLDPRKMDPEVDARMRGSIAHQALFRFYSG